MNKEIVIYKSKNKALLIILMSVLLATAGWLLLRDADKQVVGWSFFILSGLCLIFGIGTLFDKKPYIILTKKGITELSNVREEIEWDAIRQVDDFYYRGQYFIRLLTDRNYKPSLIEPTWFYRFDRLYEKEGVKALYIRMGFFEVNAIRLARFIYKMAKADDTQRQILLNTQPKDW